MSETPRYVPRLPSESENVNISREHPLREFAWIMGALIACLIGLYAALGFVAERYATRISVETEKRWFSAAFSQSMKTNTELTTVLAKLNTGEASLPADIGEECLPMPNAFAFPGMRVGVTSGLLKELKTENGLAFVIAHELGHLKHRHALRALGRQLVVVGLASLIGIGGETAGVLAQGGGALVSLRFSRDQEEEADRFATERMIQAYGHLRGADEFFVRMKEKGGLEALIPAFLSTHPGMEERIEAIRRQMNAGPADASARDATVLPRQTVASSCGV